MALDGTSAKFVQNFELKESLEVLAVHTQKTFDDGPLRYTAASPYSPTMHQSFSRCLLNTHLFERSLRSRNYKQNRFLITA